jgi:hypothetical protein
MNFNIDRIAILAGLAQGGKSGLMREGMSPAPVRASAPAKPPAPSAMTPKMPPMGGKPPSVKAPPPGTKAAPSMDEDYMGDEDYMSMGDESMGMGMGMEDDSYMEGEGYMQDETVYEVDETELMEALVDMREARLNEAKLRSAVKTELNDILKNMGGSRWIYGNKQPGNSNKGNVSRGFLGPGFR